MSANGHIVKKFELNLGIDKELSVQQVRNEMLDALNGQFKLELSQVMDELCEDGELVRIDRLELDLGNVTPENLQVELMRELRTKIKSAILIEQERQSRSRSAIERTSKATDREVIIETRHKSTVPADRELNSFVFFLKTGTFPWWSTFSNMQDVRVYIENNLFVKKIKNQAKQTQSLNTILQIVTNSEQARKRFCLNFNTEVITQFSEQWFGTKSKQYISAMKWALLVLRTLTSSSTEKSRANYLRLSLINQLIAAKNKVKQETVAVIIPAFVKTYLELSHVSISNEQIEKLRLFSLSQQEKIQLAEQQITVAQLKKEINHPNQKKLIELVINEVQKHQNGSSNKTILNSNKKQPKSETNNEPQLNKEQEELFDIAAEFGYAGAVILWPMLTTLFKNRGLIEGKEFKDEVAQSRALQLLNFLVSGYEDLPEFEMPLNKLLCGIPINEVIVFESELTDEDNDEVNALLEHVIANWSVLKNTSPRGLRDGFICRKGELTELEEGWLLTVEQKGIDIILNKLPWGYSMIKLPWMDKILQVQW